MPNQLPSRARALVLGLSLSAYAFGALAYRARADHVSELRGQAPVQGAA